MITLITPKGAVPYINTPNKIIKNYNNLFLYYFNLITLS